MKPRHIEYFLAVAESRSITAAARELHMTQPPLSQAMATLEAEVGLALFRRLPRGIELTAAGEELQKQGVEWLEHRDRVVRQVRAVGTGESGTLAISATPASWWSCLPEILERAADELPSVELEIADAPPAATLEAVSNGKADIGFIVTADPVAVSRSHRHLSVLTLSDLPQVLAVPVSRSPGRTSSITEFHEETWILPRRVAGFPGPVDMFDALWGVGPRPRTLTVSTLQSILPLLARGMGVALMPDSVLAHLTGRIATTTPLEPVPDMHDAVIWRSREPLRPVVGRFLKLLRTLPGPGACGAPARVSPGVREGTA